MAAVIETDVAIIGAGPVGLFAVFECGMLRMKSVVIDALDAVGGQCTALYPEKPIYDIPAHPAIAAADLIGHLEKQIEPFAPVSGLIGDIILARGTLVKEADEQGVSFEDHFTHLVVHGFLHLLGYDHVQDRDALVMEGLETQILASLGVADPYADD